MKKQIMIVTRNNDRLFGNPYETDENSPLLFPDYSARTVQDFRELEKFKEELQIEEISIARWTVVPMKTREE